MIISGRKLSDIDKCIEYCKLSKNFYTSVGVHPNYSLSSEYVELGEEKFK